MIDGRDMGAHRLGLKDVFTTINGLGGVAAVCLCIEGKPYAAGIAVLLGYFLGDALDGPVARWTGTANEFGREYDTISDHVAHCLAPAAIAYTVYRHADLGLSPALTRAVALGVAACLVTVGSIRAARHRVVHVDADGIWAGLPRTQAGFLAMSAANSAMLRNIPHGAWVGIALIPIWCCLALSWIPFANHRPRRRTFWYVQIAIAAYVVTTLGTLAVAPRFVFDVFFFWVFGYLFVSSYALTASERLDYRRQVALALGRGVP